MKIAEYKQADIRTEEQTILVPAEYGENGELIAEEHEEIISTEVPVMGMVYRDATAEEEAAYLAEQAELPENEPNESNESELEQRIAELENAIRILLGGDTDE